ncbi:MAG: DoxX family protein [Vicinamibacteraceae bacterium]
MKRIGIAYWIFTGLLATFMTLASIPDLLSVPQAVTLFERLGYPLYLLPFLGVAKLAGVVGVLVPGLVRIKEWAYAGLAIDLTGALYSHLCVGDPASEWWGALMGLVLLVGSYVFHYKRTRNSLILPITSSSLPNQAT